MPFDSGLSNISTRFIADRLGHINLKTTTEVYYELSKDKLHKENKKLDKFFDRIKKKGLIESRGYFSMSDLIEDSDSNEDWSDDTSDNKW